MKKWIVSILCLLLISGSGYFSVNASELSLWIDPVIPKSLQARIAWEGTQASAQSESDCALARIPAASTEKPQHLSMVYVLAAPYPTTRDTVALRTLKAVWEGKEVPLIRQILLDAETARVFTEIWGSPAVNNVQVLAADALLEIAWEEERSWALIPFDQLDPRWKVIRVDGVSPFDGDFDPSNYVLSAFWELTGERGKDCELALPALPLSNFEPDKLTSVALTGTTAMVRRLAYAIEEQGAEFITEQIAPVLRAADVTHISNEVSFWEDCAPGIPLRLEARFCSLPGYLDVLKDLGTDVIELTGNHLFDWGIDPFLYSLEKYQHEGFHTYGGGSNAEDASAPLLLEHHGNRLAFIGCNAIGPESVLAADSAPGAARCDLNQLIETITELTKTGWQVIVTFQHFEYPDYSVPAVESHDFYAAAEAGAVIISGSQAHVPQGFSFVGKSFIHFGLGNLLFDQLSDLERDSFFDLHYFYDNRYLGNTLETIRQQETMQPRFLRSFERQQFLGNIFSFSDWTRAFK